MCCVERVRAPRDGVELTLVPRALDPQRDQQGCQRGLLGSHSTFFGTGRGSSGRRSVTSLRRERFAAGGLLGLLREPSFVLRGGSLPVSAPSTPRMCIAPPVIHSRIVRISFLFSDLKGASSRRERVFVMRRSELLDGCSQAQSVTSDEFESTSHSHSIVSGPGRLMW